MSNADYEHDQTSSSSYTWTRNSSNDLLTTESNATDYTVQPNTYSSTKKIELKQGQAQPENIVAKTKRVVKQHWDQTCHSLCKAQQKVNAMVPKQINSLIYWQNPVVSGIAFAVSLLVIITYIFLSSLAATSFWLLVFLAVVGLYKLYCYVMVTFVGRPQNNIFDLIFPDDLYISEPKAQELVKKLCTSGTCFLTQARNLFLWQNLTNSLLFGLALFVFFYIGLSMNALTFVLVGLIFTFTVPKIYQVYQVPIDRTAKQILDQLNQVLAKVTSASQNKAKKQ